MHECVYIFFVNLCMCVYTYILLIAKRFPISNRERASKCGKERERDAYATGMNTYIFIYIYICMYIYIYKYICMYVSPVWANNSFSLINNRLGSSNLNEVYICM